MAQKIGERDGIGDLLSVNGFNLERMEKALTTWASQSDSAPGNENICGLIDDLACDADVLDLCAGHKF